MSFLQLAVLAPHVLKSLYWGCSMSTHFLLYGAALKIEATWENIYRFICSECYSFADSVGGFSEFGNMFS